MDNNLIFSVKITPTNAPVVTVATNWFFDSGENEFYLARIDKTLRITKQMGSFLWGTRSEMSINAMTLINIDGFFDKLLDGDYRDARVKCKIHKKDEPFSSAIDAGQFVVENVINNDDKSINVVLADKLVLLDKNTPNKYFPDTIPFADVAGTPQPIAIGTCFQVPVVLFDEKNNRYQVHQDAPVYNAGVVRDRLSLFNPVTDFTIESPIAETGGVGYNLNSPADGVVTVQMAGAAVEYQADTNRNSKFFNAFAKYLIVDLARMPSSDFDYDSANAVQNNFKFKYGKWISSPENMRDILDEICNAHCGYHQQKADGKIHFDWLKAPGSKPPALEINEMNISSSVQISIDTSPGLSDTVDNGKQYHVFTWEDIKNIGAPVTIEQKHMAMREYRYRHTSNTTTSGGNAFNDTYDHARNGCPIKAASTNPANGVALVNHLEQLYSVQRKFYQFTYISKNLLENIDINLGDEIILRHTRYGLENGKQLVITAIESEILSEKIKITAWG